MMKLDTFDCFTEAKQAYQNSKDLIRKLCSECHEYGRTLDYEDAMMSFDFIIQSMLLAEAAADGMMVPAEVHFTDKLTEYGDVLGLLNEGFAEENQGKLNWKTVHILDETEEPDKLMAGVVVLVKNKTREFVDALLFMDRRSSEKYKENLMSHMTTVAIALAAVDGDDIDPESQNEDVMKEMARSINVMNFIFGENK